MDEVRAGGCPRCGGPLHAGHFGRKPRGLLVPTEMLPAGFEERFDLCCGWCRKRVLPASVRFLGRKVYVGAAIAVATVLVRYTDRNALTFVRRHLGVSTSSLLRWRRWWQALTREAFWGRVRGLVPVDLDVSALPRSLLDRFVGTATERMIRLLRFLAPLTGTFVPEHAR